MAYAHVPKDVGEKLDSKSKTCVLLGYGSGTKGYRLYDFNAKRVLLSRVVVFNESQFMSFEKEPSKEIECVPCSFPQEEKHEDSEGELELRRSTRNRAAPDRFGEWVCFAQDKFDVPANVEEAFHGPESKLSKAAMEEEMASMNINNVWSLVECPKNKKPIRCKWIFKNKTGPDGNVCSYKARLVAQGYARKFGVDYDGTFSPVVRFESVRAVLALAAKHNLQLHHLDVATAFLNGELSEEIYLTQPEGFVSEGNENLLCKLSKSLYGLKQSPKCWNTALDGHLKQLGFKQSKNVAYIYTRVSNKGLCIIAVYVDDIIIASDCLDEINEVKSCLRNGIVERHHRTVKAIAERGRISPIEAVYWYNSTPRSGQDELSVLQRSCNDSSIRAGEEVWVKPSNANCTTRWGRGIVTGVNSSNNIEVDGVSRHVRKVRSVIPPLPRDEEARSERARTCPAAATLDAWRKPHLNHAHRHAPTSLYFKLQHRRRESRWKHHYFSKNLIDKHRLPEVSVTVPPSIILREMRKLTHGLKRHETPLDDLARLADALVEEDDEDSISSPVVSSTKVSGNKAAPSAAMKTLLDTMQNILTAVSKLSTSAEVDHTRVDTLIASVVQNEWW
ncbi:Reverse transcriptase RNA-dependent DNA polymerase [Trinorchestia longiramus]|nr:Reverse transcriptase RNA-dependent DNA polymerase [Trinorchestia longiramus]